MRKARQLPHNLKKVMDITERYFRKHGEIKPTTIFFGDNSLQVQEHEIADNIDKHEIADEMIAAAADGATAVAFVAEAWFSAENTGAPEADPERGEGLAITYEDPLTACKCVCKINRQRFGAPRLSKWEYDAVHPNRSTSGRLECIFERSRIRRNTDLTCDLVEPQLMLLLAQDGQCLRNEAGEALVVSGLLMARQSIERWSDGGKFRCVPAKDQIDQLVDGGFSLTSAGISLPECSGKGDVLRAAFEKIERTMEVFRSGGGVNANR